MLTIDITGFLDDHQLTSDYIDLAAKWFMPMINEVVSHHKSAKSPLIIGINGAQGSGKSTLAALMVTVLKQQYQLQAVGLSLDDFYYSQAHRKQLAINQHPLLATRGVPGTHDINLAIETLTALKQGRFPLVLPRFNKATDDRVSAALCERIEMPIDIIVLEGWCLGSQPQEPSDLSFPINSLETNEDSDQRWRQYVNQQLAGNYQTLFRSIDVWVMLKAPSFDCIYAWRLEQENKLRAKHTNSDQPSLMNEADLARFIQFYQRITEHTLKTLPSHVHYLFELNAQRQILSQTTQPLDHSASQWLVFTDMDGSLLDHHNYHFDDAIPTLDALAAHQIPVIPVTSKTQAEVELLRDSLQNPHPFIVENGAAVFIPEHYFTEQPAGTTQKGHYWVKEFVEPRQQWQALIHRIRPAFEGEFKTFAEVGIDGIIAMTGLNVHAAARAARRDYGEPIAWQGTSKLKAEFIQQLRDNGAQVLEGGRFLHVSGDCNKGQALQWLAEVYQQSASTPVQTLAIGDSQNDVAMLEQADFALIIRSPVHPPPSLQRQSNLFISHDNGPKGWAEGVNHLLAATLQAPSYLSPRGNHG